MSKARPGFAGLAAGILLTAATTALATTLERLSLAEIVQRSDVGVIGEVINSSSTYEDGRITTVVTIRANEVLFGSVSGDIRIRYPGGSVTVNGIRIGERVPAAGPRMEGMKAAYFLSGTGEPGVHDIVGFTQGQLDIARRGNRELIASPDQTSLLTVDDFASRVRALRKVQ